MTVEQTKRILIERAQDLSRQIGASEDPWRISALGQDLERTITELQTVTAPKSSAARDRHVAGQGRPGNI